MRRRATEVVRRAGAAAWRALRALSGDDAYDRYLEHLATRHPAARPLGRAEFHRLEQERRWNGGPNRCC